MLQIGDKLPVFNLMGYDNKLHSHFEYADKYAIEQKYLGEEKSVLKQFFVESLERGKLLKTKEVNYNKNSQQIIDIQGLHYHTNTHKFTLRIIDAKRVSTLKSLTPKRIGVGKIVLLGDEDEEKENSL
jgi:hypothetical protein